MGLWVDFKEAWALTAGLRPAPTCMREWGSDGGRRRDFMVGCPLAAAAVLSCRVQPERWIVPHLALAEEVLLFGLSGLVVTRFGKHVAMLLMPMILLVFFLYRDSSIASLLDLRRRLLAVMGVLDAMIRSGISLARSVELTAQWDKILAVGPCYLVTDDDLGVVWGLGIGEFHHVVTGLHRRLSDFIHSVVVHRRDDAIRGWRSWIREDPMVHPYRWLRPDLVLPALFLQCKPHLTPGGSGVLSDPARIDAEFRKAWLPYFCRSGQRDTSEFDREVEGWLPLLPEVVLLQLTGQMLADVVQRKSACG